MPSRMRLQTTLSQVGRDYRSEMIHPTPNGLVGEVDPDFGTGRLIGRAAVPLLDGADHDEESTAKD
jgi:hypothetical protein